jgi:hypothetical protein
MTKHDESSGESLQIISQSHDMLMNMHTTWWENQVAEISLRKIERNAICENK